MRAISRKNLWDASPRWLRRAAGAALWAVPPGLALGRRFQAALRFAREAQRWPADQARAYQLEQLRDVCTLAYERTDFYGRLFREAGFQPGDLKSVDDVADLPTIDKQTIREHLTEMCAADPADRSVDTVSTGGSGGEPLRFYIGADRSATEYAYLVAGWERAGYTLRMPQAVFRGQVVAPDASGLRHEYDPLLRRHVYSNFHMTDDTMQRYLAHVSTIGPCFLHVYPSSVDALARYIERSGRRAPENVQGVLAGSEQVYPQQRARAERMFGVRYLSWYGHSEKLVLAAECEHTTDYHVWPTYGYFELIGADGHPVTTPGQRGEIVGTGFINRVVPFIRYRTGDRATLVGHRCAACGREQTIVRDIRGHRVQETLIARDGAAISWTAMNMHDDTFDRVLRFQFYQEMPGTAVLRIVPADDFGEDERRRIAQKLERKMDGRLDVSIELVDAIEASPRGKAIYVDQRIEAVPGRANELTTDTAGRADGVDNVGARSGAKEVGAAS